MGGGDHTSIDARVMAVLFKLDALAIALRIIGEKAYAASDRF